MRRERILPALLAAAVIALSIPSIVRSLTPSTDAEIRSLLGDLTAARARGGSAEGIEFDREGRPIGGCRTLERDGYTIVIEADGRIVPPAP